MNNETNSNNNYNGQVLGSVNNGNSQPETLEMLDTTMNGNHNYNAGVNNSNVLGNQNQIQQPISNNILNSNTNGISPQMVTPEPAYTNPQNINPMPGFETANTIGTTPPISLEADGQPPKKKQNKTLFVVIIIILLFGVGFGTYYVLNYTDLLKNNPKIEIETNNLEINIGESLPEDINQYGNVNGTDIKLCTIDTTNVDVNTEGTYNYQIHCGENHKNGIIKVVDNRELEVETQKVYKVKGDTIEAKEFIANIDSKYTYEFVNQSEVDNYLNGSFGTYQVKIKVTSGSKTKEVTADLVVLEHKIIGYVTCKSNEQSVSNSSTKKVIKEEFAIVGDGKNSFGKVANEIHEFKFADETEYTSYLAKYKTGDAITIDNVTGKVKFDDTNLIITISNELSENEIISKYGETNITSYVTIRKYFIDTLGYTCTYQKVEQN